MTPGRSARPRPRRVNSSSATIACPDGRHDGFARILSFRHPDRSLRDRVVRVRRSRAAAAGSERGDDAGSPAPKRPGRSPGFAAAGRAASHRPDRGSSRRQAERSPKRRARHVRGAFASSPRLRDRPHDPARHDALIRADCERARRSGPGARRRAGAWTEPVRDHRALPPGACLGTEDRRVFGGRRCRDQASPACDRGRVPEREPEPVRSLRHRSGPRAAPFRDRAPEHAAAPTPAVETH